MLITRIDLEETGLSPNELYILHAIYEGDMEGIRKFFSPDYINDTIELLVNNGFLRRSGPNRVTLRGKTVEMFDTDPEERFVQQYRSLFEVSGRIGIMGDRKSCIRKMRLFMKENPEYSHDIILRAAKMYINGERNNENFRYLQRADYTINKNKESRLAIYCEEIMSGKTGEEEETGFTVKA